MRVSLSGVARVLAYAAMVVGVLAMLGSCVYRTRWESPTTGRNSGGYEVDGFGSWAIVTAPAALAAVVLLAGAAARLAPDRSPDARATLVAALLAAAAVPCFALAGAVAFRYWQSRLAERAGADVEVRIADGLPFVSAMGGLGAGVAALLVAVLVAAVVAERVRVPRSP